ncbi:MAG: glycosyltransferase, partial [Candidatus Paceibacteria bacterium]
ILREGGVDILHLHWIDPFYVVKHGYRPPLLYRILTLFPTLIKSLLFVIDVEITKLLGIRLVWTVHDKYDHDQNHKQIQILMGMYLSRRVDAITVASNNGEQIIRDLFHIPDEQNIYTIHHGNYIDVYEDNIDSEEARSRIGVNQNEFVYLYFGSIRAYKGIPELINAYLQLDSAGESHLLIVGNARHEESVQTAIETAKHACDITIIPEYISDNELQIYFNAANVVVLPFRDVLTSGSVILAMGFGCPLVVPNIGCIPDILPGENFLYPPGEKNLTEAMIDAQESGSLSAIGGKNYMKATNMTWRDAAQQTKEMYTSIIGYDQREN